MNVPIANVYYLLCYAWDRPLEPSLARLGAEAAERPEELLALLLIEQTHRLLRRGLDRGYVKEVEDTACPRGKLLVGPTIAKSLLRHGRVMCERDELTHDVLHNRIIAATLDSLARVPALRRRRSELHRTLDRMPRLTPLQLRPADFARVQLHRNNEVYGFVLDLCQLVLENLIPAPGGAGFEFQDFRATPSGMGLLFERFVRNFWKREQAHFRVEGGRPLEWAVTASEEDRAMLPGMFTDIWLRDDEQSIIVDCKYTKEPLAAGRSGKLRLKSSDLYQLHAYLRNAEGHARARGRSTGMLLYTQVDRPLCYDFELTGHRMLIRSVNLDQPWPAIREELLDICRGLS